MKKVSFFFLPLLFFGCAPRVQVMPYTNLTYPPTTRVEVFRTLQPERDYIELAELWINSNQPDAIQKLAEQARQLGADAILLMPDQFEGQATEEVHTGTSISMGSGRHSHGSVGIHFGQTSHYPIRRPWAIAIKYLQSSAQTPPEFSPSFSPSGQPLSPGPAISP